MNVKRVVEGYQLVYPLSPEDSHSMVVVEYDDGTFGCEQAFIYNIEFEMFRDTSPDNPLNWPTPEDAEPRFTTPEAAKLFQALIVSRQTVYDDLHAFNAPSECTPLAVDGWERDHAEQIAFVTSHCVNPKSYGFSHL